MRIVIYAVIVMTTSTLFSQRDSSIARNTFFVEALGSGVAGSINYDRLFYIKRLKCSFRGGILYLPEKAFTSYGTFGPEFFSVPIESNVFFGRKNNLVFGLGLTLAYGFNSDIKNFSEGNQVGSKEVSSCPLYFVLKPIGYRFQKFTGGLFFQFSTYVLFRVHDFGREYLLLNPEKEFHPTVGLSLGYTFKHRK